MPNSVFNVWFAVLLCANRFANRFHRLNDAVVGHGNATRVRTASPWIRARRRSPGAPIGRRSLEWKWRSDLCRARAFGATNRAQMDRNDRRFRRFACAFADYARSNAETDIFNGNFACNRACVSSQMMAWSAPMDTQPRQKIARKVKCSEIAESCWSIRTF